MKRSNKLSALGAGLCALLLAGAIPLNAAKGGIKGAPDPGDDPTPPPTATITYGAVEGDAYSLLVDVGLAGGLANVKVGPLPHARLYRDGGMDESTLANIDLMDLVSSKTLFNVTSGGTSGEDSSAESVSTVEDLTLLKGLIKAEVLSTYCSSVTDGTTASSEAGSKILGLTIADQSINISAPANTTLDLINLTLKKDGLFAPAYLLIEMTDASGAVLSSVTVLVSELTDTLQQLLDALLGDLLNQLLNSLLGTSEVQVATLTLNEQIPGGDGQTSSSMRNSAIHIHVSTELLELLKLDFDSLQIANGDIYVSATQCGVDVVTIEVPCECPECPDCPVCPPEESGFVTGGGTVGHDEGAATFATFGFNARPGKGHINVVDHELGTHVQGDTVTAFQIDGDCATFSGAAMVDHVGGYTYEATVCDNGEPGVNDTFSISTSSGYSNGGILSGGNIQLH